MNDIEIMANYCQGIITPAEAITLAKHNQTLIDIINILEKE